MSEIQSAPLSEPPNVKAERARWEGVLQAVGLLLGAVTDWIGIGAICYLAPLQHWSSEATGAAVVGLATGTIVAKLRGKVGGSTTAALLTGPTMKAAVTVAAAMGKVHS